MMSTRNQLPAIDPEEDNLVKKCQLMGASIKRLDDYNSSPNKSELTGEVAGMLASELENLKVANVRHIVLETISHPKFRKQILFPIVAELERHGREFHGQTAANALGRIVVPEDTELVAKLLLNNGIGSARSLLVPTFSRIAKEAAIPILRKLVSDPVTRSQSLKHLSILGDVSIEADLMSLAEHPDAYHRAIARDSLKRVRKNKQKRTQQHLLTR